MGQFFYSDSHTKYSDPYTFVRPKEVNDDKLRQQCDVTGIVALWYENGQKYAEGYYKDGGKQGLWSEWQENGQKLGE